MRRVLGSGTEPWLRLPAILLAAVACLCWRMGGSAQGAPVSEPAIKAAFLYKFAGYVQWPGQDAAPTDPIKIGVLGARELATELMALTAARTVSDRSIAVRRLEPTDPVEGLDILFIGADEDQLEQRFIAAAQSRPILTVTESASGIAAGSIINFKLDRQRVRFEVSLPAAERNELKLNARLLAVAQRVYRGP